MEHDLAYFRLKEEIEAFLYEEADLLDQRRFGEWLDRLADDLHLFHADAAQRGVRPARRA
jgi:3-phenylpropionate/cinnamic acid dioxygenase small subunit